jgi:ATP-dependent DNA ligase
VSVLVHKAVESDNLTVKGKKRLEAMLMSGEYVVQPKLDGVYCQIVGARAFSRTGEPLPSVRPEILAQFSGADSSWRFIGELWCPFKPHSDINGMARKKSVQPALELHLFDAVEDGQDETYAERHAGLLCGEWRTGVEVVRNLPCSGQPGAMLETMEYLYDLAAKIKAKPSAYDGLVLKDSEGLFVPGSGKDGGAIKIKPRASGDFLCVGTAPGIGNREGGMGAAVVDLGGGVRCEVGSGFTLGEVHDKGAAYFVGKILEIEYLAITKDGRLREPVYKSVRFDKTEADVLPCNVPGSD